MLLKLSGKINECLAHAADARARANATIDPRRKADLLDMELRWLRLVESYKFVEQVSQFLEDGHKRSLIKAVPSLSDNASLAGSLSALVRTVIDHAEGKARAAFYLADGGELHHIVGMPEAYARFVDGFAIGPQSLACGLAASVRQPIITRDVAEEPLWKPWLWLAEQFDYRACWSFPVETSAGKIVGTLAIYYKDPREATPRDLDVAATITRTAAIMMARQPTVQ